MKSVRGNRFVAVLAVALLGSFIVLASGTTFGQDRHKISWSAKAENTKLTVQQALEIPNIPGHIIRINEFRRTWPDGGAPTVEGQKVVEEISRGFTDIIAGNGHGSGYSVWRFENGDHSFGEYENILQTVLNPDGGRKTTFVGTYVTTGGTGKFKGMKGVGRFSGTAELDPEGKSKGNTYSAEGEYWFEK